MWSLSLVQLKQSNIYIDKYDTDELNKQKKRGANEWNR